MPYWCFNLDFHWLILFRSELHFLQRARPGGNSVFATHSWQMLHCFSMGSESLVLAWVMAVCPLTGRRSNTANLDGGLETSHSYPADGDYNSCTGLPSASPSHGHDQVLAPPATWVFCRWHICPLALNTNCPHQSQDHIAFACELCAHRFSASSFRLGTDWLSCFAHSHVAGDSVVPSAWGCICGNVLTGSSPRKSCMSSV